MKLGHYTAQEIKLDLDLAERVCLASFSPQLPAALDDFADVVGSDDAYLGVYHADCNGVICFDPDQVDPPMSKFWCFSESNHSGKFWYLKDILTMTKSKMASLFYTKYTRNKDLLEDRPHLLHYKSNGMTRYLTTRSVPNNELPAYVTKLIEDRRKLLKDRMRF